MPGDDVEALRRLRDAWPHWLALVDRLPPADVIDHVIEASAYAATLRGHRQQQARENVKKFRGLMRRIQNRGYATMARIAGHIDRVSAGDESNAAVDAADAVNLMTVHASKGLEFPIVFLVNVTRGTGGVPPPLRVVAGDSGDEPIVGIARYEPGATEAEQVRDREESKRLMYVAVTRARERLYLSAAAQRQGRIVAGPGSLAHVCPPALVQAWQGALESGVEVTWTGQDHRHRLRVCPPGRSEQSPSGPETTDVPVSESVPISLQPLVTQARVRRGRVTDVAAGTPSGVSAARQWPLVDTDLVIGRAVHRLLGRAVAHDSDAALRSRVLADLDAEEAAALADTSAFARDVVALVRGVWQDDRLRRALASPAARFEVPIVFRHEEAGAVHLVRGTIDCLVPDDDRLLVLEFKTGQARPAHQRQLALYVDAVRAMQPGVQVIGQLVYATRPVAARAMSAPLLPFDI